MYKKKSSRIASPEDLYWPGHAKWVGLSLKLVPETRLETASYRFRLQDVETATLIVLTMESHKYSQP